MCKVLKETVIRKKESIKATVLKRNVQSTLLFLTLIRKFSGHCYILHHLQIKEMVLVFLYGP